ncbi:hypothetical protein [Sporosarcina sp. FA9]|uniref:hypothetical protein n=1 Tax=Sporosarcina sp. FA9 TaxID=3413030 RepID=UPI003F655A0C
MKKFQYILLVALLLLLSACKSDEGQSPSTKENAGMLEEKEDVNDLQGQREKKPVADIEEDTLYTWEINEQTNLLLVREQGEIEVFEDNYAIGSVGERQYSGNVALYIVIKDEENGILQERLEDITLNLDRAFSIPYSFNGEQFIVWVQPEATNVNTLGMWRYTDGEIKSVQFDVESTLIVSHQQMKFLKDTYLQVYFYNNDDSDEDGIGWIYRTWKWDNDTAKFTEHAVKKYTQNTRYGWESGEYTTKLWHEHSGEYVLFPEMTMTDEVIDLIKNGQLLDNDIRIGQSIDKVLGIMPDYTVNEYYEGAPYYSFPGPSSYFYNEVTREITGISLSAGSLTNDLASIKAIFGDPDEDSYDEMEEIYVLLYTVGDYLLRVNYDENGELSGFWLL